MVWIVVACIVVGVAAAVVCTVLVGLRNKAMLDYVNHLPDFQPSQHVMGEDGKSGIAIDESRRKVCLIMATKGQTDARVLDYGALLSSEIAEDGRAVMRTSRTSQIGGALVGGALLGGVGAVVGGLSGKKLSADKVKRIDLHITVNDTIRPIHTVTFLNLETNKGGILYTQAIKKAQHWHALVDVLIKQG